MSVETKRAVDYALQAHFADESEATLITWVVVCKGKNVDNVESRTTRYSVDAAEGTDFDTVLGLAHYAVLNYEAQFNE